MDEQANAGVAAADCTDRYGGPFSILRSARACSCLTVHEFAVLTVLVLRADNETGACTVSAAILAAEAKVSDRGARNAVEALAAAGWVLIERRTAQHPDGTRAWLPHRFTLSMPGGHDCHPKAKKSSVASTPLAPGAIPSGTGYQTSSTGCRTPLAPDTRPLAPGAEISALGSAGSSALPPPGNCRRPLIGGDSHGAPQLGLPIDRDMPHATRAGGKKSRPEPETARVWIALREAYAAAFGGLEYPAKPDAADNNAIKKLTVSEGVEEAIRLIRTLYAHQQLARRYTKAKYLGDAQKLRAEIASTGRQTGASLATPRRGMPLVQRAPPGSAHADPEAIRNNRPPEPPTDADGELILWDLPRTAT